MEKIMKDPFGTATSNIVLTAAGEVVKKEPKKTDLVKIYLASIMPLEQVKDSLMEIAESAEDPAIKKQVEGFVESILTISEQILDLTKTSIRGVRQEVKDESAAPKATPEITPEMISGLPTN